MSNEGTVCSTVARDVVHGNVEVINVPLCQVNISPASLSVYNNGYRMKQQSQSVQQRKDTGSMFERWVVDPPSMIHTTARLKLWSGTTSDRQ